MSDARKVRIFELTKDNWVQIGVGVGAVVVFGAPALFLAHWILAHSDTVTVSCADLDGVPSGLVFRLEECEPDLSDFVIEERNGLPVAVYTPLVPRGGSGPSPIVLRTTNPTVVSWVRGRRDVGASALRAWTAQPVFLAVGPGPLGGRKGIDTRDIAQLLRGEADPFVIVNENESLFGLWATVGLIALGVLAGFAIVFLVLRDARRRARRSAA